MPTYAQYVRFLAENSGPFFKVVREGGQERLVQIPDIWESARGQNFPLRKPPGARRVVVLGESSADALASSLQRLAGTEPAAASLEVMDCAAGGGDLELMERRFNEVMRYSPDVVVVLFGHNLFYHHPYRSPLWRSLSRFLRRSRLLALAADRLLSFKSYFSPHPSSARWVALENFLRLAARRTQKRGVTLILCTVPGNLWYPPDGGARERRDPRYLRALFLANTGREREAVAELREAALFEPSA
ncbi:MAG: hypothetical protein KGL04_10140, partial [Elusimicrobia bacterium]|nr:hypothetical protein [Elusimicrobiota bacterium]